jgi:hypothetical protein
VYGRLRPDHSDLHDYMPTPLTCRDHLALLRATVQHLALPAEEQLALLPSFVCKADELALNFDERWLVVRSNCAEQLSADQRSAIEAIDRELDFMTRAGAALWTDEAVQVESAWEHVRSLAAAVLDAFGWPHERPDGLSVVYVGKDRVESI